MAKGKAFRVTLPALITALGLLFLYLSCVMPTGRWALVAIAGVLIAAVVVSAGLPAAAACWAATSLLGLLLLPDRLNLLLYFLFFGAYSLLKSLLERVKPLWLGYLGKLAFFNAVLTLFLLAFSGMFLPALSNLFVGRLWLLYVVGNVIFVIYDFGFTKLISFYVLRVDKALKR